MALQGPIPVEFGLAFTMKTYVHASDDDLQQGRQALAKIHRLA